MLLFTYFHDMLVIIYTLNMNVKLVAYNTGVL